MTDYAIDNYQDRKTVPELGAQVPVGTPGSDD